MYSGKPIRFVALYALLFVGLASADTVRPINTRKENVLRLGDYAGRKTFFEVMTMEGGIREKLDKAFETEFTMADSDAVLDARDKFTAKVTRNVLRDFKGSQRERLDAFTDLVDDLAGQRFTNGSLKTTLRRRGLTPWSIADFLTMASGASVLVHIDSNNYYYNVSYEAAEVNSGRSFGAGPSHKADDASYPFYLRQLRAYYQTTEDLGPFFKALMAILTESDPSGVSDMSDEAEPVDIEGKREATDGQTLLTDFVTVYTAELYRHINSDLKRHDWENALAELTFVSAYSDKAGLVQKDGEIVKGTPSDWRYVGEQGSGIGGKSGIERRSFQRKVCKAARDLRIKALEDIDSVTGRQADCFRGIMVTLNNYGTQAKVRANAKKLTTAVVRFLGEIREKSDAITAKIPGTP